MIGSNEVSALIAAQNSQMVQLQRPMGMGVQPMTGASHYPPQFNYGQFQQQYAPGRQTPITSAAAAPFAVMAAAPKVAMGIGMGAGVAQMFSNAPALQAAGMMDPMTGGMTLGSRAFGIAGGGARGMMAAGAAGLGFAGALGAGYMAVSTGAQMSSRAIGQQNQMAGMFSHMQFANAGSMTGRGFSTREMGGIADTVRSMDMEDAYVNMQDAMGIAKKFTDLGMEQGIRDAGELKTKLKRMGESVKKMAEIMGTTIDEASKVYGEMRQSGFYSASDVMGNTRQMLQAGGMGMRQETFMGMQTGAAGMATGMQMSGRTGAMFTGAMAPGLMAGSQAQGERLMEITGATTVGEAVQRFSMGTFQRVGGALTQGAMGQGLLATLGQQDASGRFMGGINEDAISRMASGGIGLQDLSSMGARNLGSSTRSKASFALRNRDIAQTLLQDPRAMGAVVQMFQNTAGERFGDMDQGDAFGLLMKQNLGLDRRESDMMREMYGDYAVRSAESGRAAAAERGAEQYQLWRTRHATIGGVAAGAMGGARDMALAPIERGMGRAYTGLQAGFEDVAMSAMESWGYVPEGFSERARRRVTIGQTTAVAQRMAAGGISDEALTAFSGGDDLGVPGGSSLAFAMSKGGAAKAGSIYRMAKMGAGAGVVKGLGSTLGEADRAKLSKLGREKLASDGDVQAKVYRVRQLTTRNQDATQEKLELRRLVARKGGLDGDTPEGKAKVDYLLGEAGGGDIVAGDMASLDVTGTGSQATSEQANAAYLEAIGHEAMGWGYDSGWDAAETAAAGAIGGASGGAIAGAALAVGVIGGSMALAAAGLIAAPITGGTSAVAAVAAIGALSGGITIGAWGLAAGGKARGDKVSSGVGKNLLSALKDKEAIFSGTMQRVRALGGSEEEVYEAASKVLQRKLKRSDITAEDVKMVEGLLDREAGGAGNPNMRMFKKFTGAARMTEDIQSIEEIRESISAEAGSLAQRTDDRSVSASLEALSEAALGVTDKESEAEYQRLLGGVVEMAGRKGVDLEGMGDFGETIEAAAALATQVRTTGGGLTEEAFAKKFLGGNVGYLKSLRKAEGTGGKKITPREAELLSKRIGAGSIQATIGAETAASGQLIDEAFGGAKDFETVARSLSQMAEMVDLVYSDMSGKTPRLGGPVQTYHSASGQEK